MEQGGVDGKGERLSASKLKRHADALIGLLDCAKWAKTQSWQPFMLLPTGSCIAGAGRGRLRCFPCLTTAHMYSTG